MRSSIARQLREASLGPTPSAGGGWIFEWVGYATLAHHAVLRHIEIRRNGESEFTRATNTVRRMFLLLVAEAV